MKEKTLGLYVHIPFCVAKCHYCDFCSFPGVESETKQAYTDALITELQGMAAAAQGHTVDTVFFGGGTPTCLTAQQLSAIADCIHRHYRIAPDVEWTSEANPAAVTREQLHAMRACGFNRISLGMQSAHENELALLGRVHRPRDLYRAVEDIRAAGFDNFNLDLMFAIPSQTTDSFAASLDEAISLSPAHLSVYSLQIEEGTPFYQNRATLPLPSEEQESEMAAYLYQKTAKAGYRRYEISNFARPGMECRHNLRYWCMQDYLGFGIAAHSCFDGERFYNRASLSDYVKAPCSQREQEEVLTPAEQEYETVMLGLRLSEGIDEQAFYGRFGYGFFEKYAPALTRFIQAGLVLYDGQHTALTEAGMAVCNAILAEILD